MDSSIRIATDSKASGDASVYKSLKEGSDQTEFEDEDSNIHKECEEAIAGASATCEMGGLHPYCSFS